MALRIAAFLSAGETVPTLLRDIGQQDRTRFVEDHLPVNLVFMSHKTVDYNDAQVPARQLAAAGLAVYFVEDDQSVAPGDRDTLPDEIKTVLRKCTGLLLFASDTLVDEDASWVCFEVGLAEMIDMETARYTTTCRGYELLSPLRRLSAVEGNLGQWAKQVLASSPRRNRSTSVP